MASNDDSVFGRVVEGTDAGTFVELTLHLVELADRVLRGVAGVDTTVLGDGDAGLVVDGDDLAATTRTAAREAAPAGFAVEPTSGGCPTPAAYETRLTPAVTHRRVRVLVSARDGSASRWTSSSCIASR